MEFLLPLCTIGAVPYLLLMEGNGGSAPYTT
jgi:hypothetical protein